ncbi:MAG TPA: calcium-translocating P-type ATPase, PMCA-type [Pyrinomonadaceae bacterium]
MSTNLTTQKEHQPRFAGLTKSQVEESRRKHGLNILTPPERDPWWKLFLEKFDDPVIRILIVAAVVAIGVGIFHGEYLEGVGIVIAILLATTLAFLNEYKANKEFDILNQVTDEDPVKVIREGQYTTVPRKDVVVGDIALVEVGEEIPADGNVIEAVSLQVDESRLTGESMPVNKVGIGHRHELEETERELAYPPDRILKSTIARDGHAIMEVQSVGDATEIGKTARAAAEETDEDTPLNMQLERLSKMIGVIGFGVAALTFVALVVRGVVVGEFHLTGQQWFFAILLIVSAMTAIIRVWLPIVYDAFELVGKKIDPPGWLENDSLAGWLKTILLGGLIFGVGIGAGYALGLVPAAPRDWLPYSVGEEFLKYFMIAVTIIVVAVPEGLAMSVTLSLAYSMRKMTASNNLVRRMHACETIGAATVICSDKTGTLTLNEMRVHALNLPALKGKDIAKELASDAGKLFIEAIAANTTANLGRGTNDETKVLGNPTEGALLMWLEEQGVDYILSRDAFEVARQLTFTTERKFMATLGTSGGTGRTILHVKGAPEIIIERCTQVLTPEGVKPIASYTTAIEEALLDYQARGMRTLAFAYQEAMKNPEQANIEEMAQELIWLGFAAIADPIRPEVPAALNVCRNAGVMVKIVTGDNPQTAQEIARQIGLLKENENGNSHIGGREFSALSEEEAMKAALDLKVLSRARPMDKLRLVKLLQEQNQVVAVTGDGVNDGPALNYANVGLAMGKTGTAVAKEASDIILLDDSFQSIAKAIMWGRSLYENIQRFVLFQLTINVVALGIALLGPFLGVKLPLTVTQMLWVNLIMDTFAALALATEPPSWSVMKRPPRHPKDFIINRTMAINIFTIGGIFLVFLIGFLLYLQRGGIDDTTEAGKYKLSVFFSVFVLLQFWNLFNAKTLGRTGSAFSRLSENKSFLLIAFVILAGQILIVQFGADVFRTVPLSWKDWAIIISSTSVVLWIGEIWRLIKRGKSVETIEKDL